MTSQFDDDQISDDGTFDSEFPDEDGGAQLISQEENCSTMPEDIWSGMSILAALMFIDLVSLIRIAGFICFLKFIFFRSWPPSFSQ